MILQALYEYYKRKPEIHAPIGYELEELDFIVVINKDGELVDLQNKRENKRGHQYFIPKAVVRSGKKILPNLLWDNFEYTTGLSKDSKRSKKAQEYNKAFIDKLNSLPMLVKEDEAIKSILNFYASDFQEQLKDHPNFEECLKINGWMTFQIDGDIVIIPSREVIRKYQAEEFLSGKFDEDELKNVRVGVCLITGNKTIIKRLHTELRLAGSDKNVKIVAIQENQGYDSYNKERGYNSPVSIEAEANYSAALKHLLNSKSNKINIADTTILFWAEKKSEENDPELILPWVIAFQKSDADDPDKGVRIIESFINSIFTGKKPIDKTNHFYVLGLSPNAARISVRFWKAPSVEEFGKNIKQHFEDFEIVHGVKDAKYLSLYQILSATALGYEMKNVPPNLAGAVIESIIDGTPYPTSLLYQCIRRIRAEQNVNRTRAAILKAYLNRFNKIHKPNQKEITMGLDPTNTISSYLVGRLFAVLEKIQEEANPGINATIKDRFYGAASSTPITVYPRLLSLKNSHIKKLNVGRKIYFEKLLSEIISDIKCFPANLSLNEQANFALGYYHQRQDFFTKKSDKNETVHQLENNNSKEI